MTNNIKDLTGQERSIEEMLTQVDSLHKSNKPLHNGSGGGGDMEQRVQKLEADMSFIKGKLEDMPTKDWMTTRLIWVVGAFVTITGLIQFILDKISTVPIS